jgi:hypothetical protein
MVKIKSKFAIFFTPYASTKDVQATGEALSPQKRDHPTLQKHEISSLFSIFVGHFCPTGS